MYQCFLLVSPLLFFCGKRSYPQASQNICGIQISRGLARLMMQKIYENMHEICVRLDVIVTVQSIAKHCPVVLQQPTVHEKRTTKLKQQQWQGQCSLKTTGEIYPPDHSFLVDSSFCSWCGHGQTYSQHTKLY